jgi:hypothetical protein
LYIGIDFSINSPGICIRAVDHLQFIAFYNREGKNFKKGDPKDFQIHREISNLEGVSTAQFNRRKKHDDYSIDQSQKIEDSHDLATLISSQIPDGCPVGLEGYSYGSKGNSFIDLIAFNSVLRNRLYLDGHGVRVFTPSQVKTRAGKGNLNKQGMFLAFVKNRSDDHLLQGSEFWKWCVERRDYAQGEIPKPIDDLVDAYWISRLLSGLSNSAL